MSNLFRESIPDQVLEENLFADKLVTLLDELQGYKKENIFSYTRLFNPVLLTNLPFYRKIISSLGYEEVPEDFTKLMLDDLYLNAENIFSSRGSYYALDNWLRCISQGSVNINMDAFLGTDDYIILSDIKNGVISTDTDIVLGEELYLFSDYSDIEAGELIINIATPYFSMESMKSYIREHIKKYISFFPEEKEVTVNFSSGSFVKNIYTYYF